MAEGKWHSICRVVRRKRGLEAEGLEPNALRRCLNRWDLTALGVGSTLGIGVYVVVGTVALRMAGPSILLSFVVAAIIALLSGLCYAEFGARVPLAGSSYIYAYVTIGELVGFLVGWNNILEFVFGSASVARGLSSYIDELSNHSMSTWYQQNVPIPVPLLSSYFDLLSFFIVMAIGVLLVIGVRESSLVNNVFSAVNVIIILFVILAGSFKADSSNWSIPAEQVSPGLGSGGFFPYGVWGMLRGAAVCFYGFVGFDVMNASGEEVKNPRSTIPTAILMVLGIVFIAYAGVSIVLTMMVPYYEISAITSVSTAFSHVGLEWAWWIVVIGSIFGLTSSLFGAIFPLPRLLYSMASDGLLFHWFAKVSTNKKSLIVASALPTVVIALLSAILDLDQLVLMMCIGTLTSYTIVAICVVLLRYQSEFASDVKAGFFRQMIGRAERTPTRKSKRIINAAMALYICLCIAIAVVFIYAFHQLVVIIILHILALITITIMALQPACDEELSFRTPLVPFLPCVSIYANIQLMVVISWHTWVRVLIWILIGIPIYLICICCYAQNDGERKEDTDLSELPRDSNCKPSPVQIVVVSPTPPSTVARFNSYGEQSDEVNAQVPVYTNKTEQIMVQHLQFENNEEKEAKIIDLLDQVLQAEEDSYGEIISLKENKEEDEVVMNGDEHNSEGDLPHRKSLSELSDAGSDASLGNQVLSKYDVIAQVHREDLPKVNEEEEINNHLDDIINNEDEEITAFNDSETNSRTDESGYSDTIDRPTLDSSLEDTNISNIPVPPPFNENYFKMTPITFTIKKYNTISSRYSKGSEADDDNISEPRVSLQSNNSQGDANIRFGSDRQIKFMSKLNNIFQKTISNEEEEPRKRSHSTGNVVEANLAVAESRQRPQLFLDLKKELLARESLPSLRPVNTEEVVKPLEPDPPEPDEEEEEEKSLSRADLKSKLENIFAVGGPQLLAKPRLMKSNPPTPEESYQTDQSSTESIAKLPKMEKNDTLKRQKDKFGQVLKSIRLSMNQDDLV